MATSTPRPRDQPRKAIRRDAPALRDDAVENWERCGGDGEENINSGPIYHIEVPYSPIDLSVRDLSPVYADSID